MVSEEALKKLQEQIAAWPMTQRFVVQYLCLRPYVICMRCHAQIPCYNNYEKAKEAWNRRVDNG